MEMKPHLIVISLIALLGCGCSLKIDHLLHFEGSYFKPWGREDVTRPVRVETRDEALVKVFRVELEKSGFGTFSYDGYDENNPSLDIMFKGRLYFADGLNHKIKIFNNGDAIIDTDEELYFSRKQLDAKAVRDFLELLAE